MTLRTETNQIVVHCAVTKPSMDIGLEEIDKWHRARGFVMIGYHFVIRRGGLVERGRPLMVKGAHAKGQNSDSIGICLAGGIDEAGDPELNFTDEQYESLYALEAHLLNMFPNAVICGHCDLDPSGKPHCPGFDASALFEQRKAA